MEKVRSSSFDRKPEDLPLCLEALIYLAVELAAGFFALMKTALRVLPQRFFCARHLGGSYWESL